MGTEWIEVALDSSFILLDIILDYLIVLEFI